MDDIVLKDALASIASVEDDSAPHGAFDVILSTPAKDRDGEEVKAAEWQTPLPDHITFDVDHGMSVASTVGSGRPEIQADGTLRVRGTFASTPLAQQTRALVKEGHIRTTSVAFMRRSVADPDSKDGARKVSRELLNGAFVAVPANAEAVVLGAKAADLKARTSAADPASIQAVHDVAKALGANCADPSLGDGPMAGTGSKAVPDGQAETDAATTNPAEPDMAALGLIYRSLAATYSEEGSA